MPRRILLATDFQNCSIHAIKWAAKNLLRDFDNLILVSSVQDIPDVIDTDMPYGVVVGNSPSELKEQVKNAKISAQQWCEALKNELCNNLKLSTEFDVSIGSPGEVVIDKINQYKPDFVLLGTHNRGAVSEFFMGSVSKYVLHHTKIPCVIISESD